MIPEFNSATVMEEVIRAVKKETKNKETVIHSIAKNLESLEAGTSFSNPPMVIIMKAHQKASQTPPR